MVSHPFLLTANCEALHFLELWGGNFDLPTRTSFSLWAGNFERDHDSC